MASTDLLAQPARMTPIRRRSEFLPFALHSIGEDEIAEVVDTLRSQWITTGPKTKRFEQEFAAKFGAPGALALNSCTAALHAALATSGVGPGDEVITTPVTFTATANVIEHLGARPVFADVEPDTLNISPKQIEAVITSRTKVIMPVHFTGHPADLDAIADLATAHGATVVEDAAHSLPAKYKGRWIGSSSNPTAFSFYATKNLTTGEGGMLTGTPEFLERARVFCLHGLSRDAWQRYAKGGSWFYEVLQPGFKYNMPDIQAALGLGQLRRLGSFDQRRREIVARYNEAFGAEDALEIPTERADVEHAWHLYVLRIRGDVLRIGRDQFIDELTSRSIGTSVHFIPLHLHPFYRDTYGYKPDDFPVAYSNYTRMLSLPLYPAMSDEDVTDVISAVVDIVRANRR